ncbi:hypothetical protein FP2506_15449 [Fulvimarina pelagi HTCC2506]|uniref:DUF427 domain-containing protein n=1 Tax=Fulvimarina pelagi HTCC2506 TaxID=314231 RepID=Q0G3J0_9HYPH|nr:DUF427 domain-containing protein [Fulvimarina pelagi]EAU41841.1 hypothetical protein FP2506_15449 [Fulvimarina pelagi HTCC2506]
METHDRITIEKAEGPVNITFNGAVLASTKDALILREKGYDPVYYFPKDHVAMAFLKESETKTSCPHKGDARYWNISAEGQAAMDAVWAYDEPHAGVKEIAGRVAFDRSKVTIDDGA